LTGGTATFKFTTVVAAIDSALTVDFVADNPIADTDATNNTGSASYTWPTPAAGAVTWTNMVGMATCGVDLYKTAATSWSGNGGAVSTMGIQPAGGSVEFVVPASPGKAFFGLNVGSANGMYDQVDYAFYTYTDTNTLLIFENGVQRYSFGGNSIVAGDILRITIQSGVVTYRRNNTLAYTSTIAPAFPQRATVAAITQGARVRGAVLSGNLVDLSIPTEPVVWQHMVGVSGTTSLTKTSAGWGNAGASSTRGITSGSDGYAEFTVPSFVERVMFGLSNGDASTSYAEIDYAFYTYPTGTQLVIYENGVARLTLANGYAVGDKLQVSIEGGVVKYRRNGTVLYTSSVAPTYPLRVDTGFFVTGAVVQDAKLAGPLVDTVP
jgi:hypothetical protein